ncbi:hypothetical protein U1Q18_018448 [Sarracenia purpurea var. burkii]
MVGFPVIFPNLAAEASEWAEVAHLDHSIGEVGEESGRAGTVGIDLGVGGVAVEELLVGVQQPLLALQIREVGVVERCWACGVQRRQVVSIGARTV